MERRLNRLRGVSAALCSLALMMPLPLHAAAADIAVSQMQCVMPEIRVYLHADEDIRQEPVKAFLDSEALAQPEIRLFAETKEPVCCCILLDNSGSVPKNYVEPLRQAVIGLGKELRTQDTLCVYTVGERTNKIYEGSGKDAALAEALEDYRANEQETVLFDALVQCAKDVQKKGGTEFVRSTALVFSDGVNEAAGAAVYEEAVQQLQEAQLPVYAFGLGNDTAGLDSFGQLARAAGGSMQRVQPAEAEDALKSTVHSLENEDYVITVQAGSNELGGVRELELQIGGVTKKLQFTPYKWVPDQIPPEILSVEQTAENVIRINFSEDVRGADSLSNFLLRSSVSEKEISLDSVRYVKDNGSFYALLEPGIAVTSGNYSLRLLGITDVSQEQNPLAEDTQEVFLRGIAATADYGQNTAIWLIPLLLVAAVLGVSIFFLRRKPQQSAVQADLSDGIVSIPSDGVTQVRVRNPEGVPRSLRLTVSSPNAAPVELPAVIGEALLFGRSSGKCNISFEDPAMSRVHFRLEVRGTELWITDCGSTSGTKVNGTLLTAPAKLSQGDVVAAGVTEITVRW